LNQFAKSTGLVVSLYDSSLKLVSGPHTPNPLSEKFKEANLWQQDGPAVKEERSLIQMSMKSGEVTFGSAFGTLSIAAIPLKGPRTSVGYLVAGWMFDHFADPVESDRLAKKINVPAHELWMLIRQHNPVPPKKLESFTDLLAGVSYSRLIELSNKQVEINTSRILKILNRTSQELTLANTLEDIEKFTIKAALELTEAATAQLFLVGEDGALTLSSSKPTVPLEELQKFNVSDYLHLKTPIEASDGTYLGVLEVLIEKQKPEDHAATVSKLAALSAQVAVAIQKVKLITDLQKERGHLRNTLDELKRASLVRDQFLATLSHELRTPLTAMMGWCQMLRTGVLDEEMKLAALETIERNARAQSQLIEDLLDASRIISGKMTLNLKSASLIGIVKEAIRTVSPAAGFKGVKVLTDFPDTEISVSADSVRLQQVFWNILSNAVKFTPEGGQIKVSALVDHEGVQVEIADTGSGISAEFLPYVFDRFSQADSSFTRTFGGLGLGLAIVKQLVELHGGSVSVESKGKNQGAKFFVRLPLKAIASNSNALSAADRLDEEISLSDADIKPFSNNEKLLTGYHLLIVDDTPDSLLLMKLFAEKQGATVTIADSADKALSQIVKTNPDILVSDISMPTKDGVALIKELRSLTDKAAKTPAVAVTAYTREEDKARVLEAGFNAYVSKPIVPAEFIRVIASLKKA